MSSELSPKAKVMSEELKKMPIGEAIYSCLDVKLAKRLNKSSDVAEITKQITRAVSKSNSKCYLFADSTAVQDREKIVERSIKWIKEGFMLNGCKYVLKSPFKWSHPKGVSRNHQYKIQAWIMIDELLRASLIDSKNKFLETSRQVAIDWIDSFLFGEEVDEFSWYDMGAGQRASLLAYITHKTLLDNSISKKTLKKKNHNSSNEDILKLIIAADIHIHELMSEDRLAIHSNHGLFQMAGLLALSSSLPFLKSAKEARTFSMGKIESMLKNHFFEDGFHKEHSPMYHMFLSNYLYQLNAAGWLEGSSTLESLTQNAIVSTQKFIMPNGLFAPIGDSNMRYSAKDLCLFDVNTDSLEVASCPPGLHIFEEGGVAIMATNDQLGKSDEHLVLSAQFHSRQHKHADDLTLNYCVKGHPYLIDAGTFTYHYDQLERMYIESTKAHNTIEIDGLNNSRFRLDAYGSGLSKVFQIGNCTVMEAKIDHKNLVPKDIPNNVIKTTDGIEVKISHTRLVINKPQHFMAVIDILNSEVEHQYSQWFHFAPRLNLDKITNDRIEVEDKKDITNSTIHILTEKKANRETQIFRGEKTPELIGWHSKDGLKLEPNYSLVSTINAKSAVMSTIFDLKGNSRTPFVKVGSNGRYIRFSINHGSKFDITIRDKRNGEYNVKCLDDNQELEKIFNWK